MRVAVTRDGKKVFGVPKYKIESFYYWNTSNHASVGIPVRSLPQVRQNSNCFSAQLNVTNCNKTTLIILTLLIA